MQGPHVLAGNRCSSCPSRLHGPCKGVQQSVLQSIAGVSSTASYAPGATIIAQGESVHHLGIVRHGTVKISNTTADGRHMVIGLIEDGRLIGNASIGAAV